MIGRLGNAGSTGGPHLYFGLLDYSDPLVGDSLPIAGSLEPQTDTLQLVYTVADFGD